MRRRQKGAQHDISHVIAELLRPLLEGVVALSRKPLGLDDSSKRHRVVDTVDSPALAGHLLPHRVRLLDAVLQNNLLSQLPVNETRIKEIRCMLGRWGWGWVTASSPSTMNDLITPTTEETPHGEADPHKPRAQGFANKRRQTNQ